MDKTENYTIRGLCLLIVISLVSIFLDFSIISLQILRMELIYYIALLVYLFALLLQIYGLYLVYRGRKEYSKKHQTSVKIAVVLLIVGYLLMMFVASFMIIIWYMPLTYAALVGMLSIPFALGAVFLIKELADRPILYLLWGAFVANIVLLSYSRYVYINEVLYYGTKYIFWSNDFVLSVMIATIPGLLILYCYYKILEKIKIGKTFK